MATTTLSILDDPGVARRGDGSAAASPHIGGPAGVYTITYGFSMSAGPNHPAAPFAPDQGGVGAACDNSPCRRTPWPTEPDAGRNRRSVPRQVRKAGRRLARPPTAAEP